MINEQRAVHAGVGTRELFVEGNGPTVVLLHGFGHPADSWGPVLDRFARVGQAAVAVDLPGFGAADATEPGAWLPQGDRFVSEVIARHGAQGSVVLVGNSLGAYLAVRAAASPSQLPIRGMVLTATPGLGWTPLARAALVGQGRLVTGAASIRIPRWIRGQSLDTLVSYLLYGDRTAVDPELVRILSTQVYARRAARELLTRALLMKAEVDSTPPVTGITCPTVVVHGRRDRIVALASSERLHQAIPRSRLVVLANAGHCPQLDAPDEIVGFARGLLRDSPGHSTRA